MRVKEEKTRQEKKTEGEQRKGWNENRRNRHHTRVVRNGVVERGGDQSERGLENTKKSGRTQNSDRGVAGV